MPGNNSNTCPCPAPVVASQTVNAIKQPKGIAIDEFGNFFVSNSGNNTLTVYGTLTAAPVLTLH